MENYNQKNNSNINCDYDLIYLILKNNSIVAVYDNYDIAFVKFTNLIFHDIEIIDRLKLSEELSETVKNELNGYKLITLIKNSDIKINNISLCMNDFVFKENNQSIIDINFLETKIRYYILNKILEIKSLYHNFDKNVNITVKNIYDDKKVDLEEQTEDLEEQTEDLEEQTEDLEEQTEEKDKNILLDKINKLESIKILQEEIASKNKENESENEEYIQKVIDDKKELEAKIKKLKLKKERLKEKKNIYDADLNIYNVVKKNLDEDSEFKIPELFIRKYEIFLLMDEKKNISFEEYLKYNPYKLNIKVSDNYNKIFDSPEDSNVAYLSDVSEYSESSDSNASSLNNDIEIDN